MARALAAASVRVVGAQQDGAGAQQPAVSVAAMLP
jgi:hypothetical protein